MLQRLFFRAQNASVLGKCARFFYGRMSGNWRFLSGFCRIVQLVSCIMVPVPVFPLYPCFSSTFPVFLVRWIREGIWGRYGRYRGRIWRMGIGTDTGTEGGHGEYIRYSSVSLCHCHYLCFCVSLCGFLLPSSSFLLWYSFPLSSFFFHASLVSPCLQSSSIHSLIRLHGYPFAITDNRLTGPHTLRYAITRK